MTIRRKAQAALAGTLALLLVGGIAMAVLNASAGAKTRIVAYFDNSNGIYAGDDVFILGVSVGKVEKIEPQPMRAKITFYVDAEYKVPADAKAAIVSPTLVTARAIQLTPVYARGPAMKSGAIIPQDRTAVPVEFDDLRKQLDKLTATLQPDRPGGVSTLGDFINTAADNLRGQGVNIRDTLIKVSQAFSVLGDHSNDIFGTVKNLAVLVSALQSSTDLMRQLNQNLASVTGLLADDPNAIANAADNLNKAVVDVQSFIGENREPLGTTADKLTSVSNALVESIDDIKQTLHIAPTAFQNFVNIYHPAYGAFTGALAVNQFSDPIAFLCGAIQAASRLNNEQSAKLCVQYLAPIVKNRQYNFLPLGGNPFAGPIARPNEVTFSEDWLRGLSEPGQIRDHYEGPLPDEGHPPPGTVPPVAAPIGVPQDSSPVPLPAQATPTDPAAGLSGLMTPPGGGS
ncbi:MCE family protein [Mycobacterium sp.]|uniref:MCE family protein n=1 Tax=Mycobacterium sp. TaxID=1785 RepID=UPI00120B0EFB|nr:MCE family protein [Mycobacterium sp.]TAM65198.1 MAG: MCE family protein [Mycobacterium sp.]